MMPLGDYQYREVLQGAISIAYPFVFYLLAKPMEESL